MPPGFTRIHFTILTLASAQIVHALFVSGLVFRPFGGVGRGLFLLGGGGLYLPRFTIAGLELEGSAFDVALYYVIVGALLGSTALLWRIVHSPFGTALHAIRDNQERALMIGIHVRRYRWVAFVLSAIFTGLAGGLWGQLSRQVTPEQLHWLFSAELAVAVLLGGMRGFWGPIFGAVGLVLLQEIALRATLLHGLLLGLLLIAMGFLCPGGIAAAGPAVRRRLLARAPP